MISIIIPVYNVEKYLAKCLDSVLHQTYHDIEVILVDDGSIDESGIICDEYAKRDNRISVYHRENCGVSATRNFGLKKAKGEWILFVDSDDWISNRLLEICFRYLSPKTDICFFGFNGVKEKESIDTSYGDEIHVKQLKKKDFLGLQYRIFNRDREACCDRNLIKLSSPCKLFRKELLIRNEIYFPENLTNGEDGVLNLYAYQYAKSGVCIEHPLYYYRMREDSITHKYTESVEKDFRDLHDAYYEFIHKFDDTGTIFNDVMLERMIWSFSFCCILKYCHPGNRLSYFERRKQFLKEFNYYEDAIKAVQLQKFGVKKRVIFYFIKKKKFLIVSLLCNLQRRMEAK